MKGTGEGKTQGTCTQTLIFTFPNAIMNFPLRI